MVQSAQVRAADDIAGPLDAVRDRESIKQNKAHGEDDQQIHCRNLERVIAQESPPALISWPTRLDHVFGDAGLGDGEAELEQFATALP
jgi:hypothetical protein